LDDIPDRRILINTINAYSWVMADKDPLFKRSLIESDYLLPDGVSIA
jgi:N-acetylglucosaminyldiphosphoundecaprenol N-acetyl-beta-D-mannosaminyltransferase